jgi:hypothetical protein
MVSFDPRRALCVACGTRRTNLYPAGSTRSTIPHARCEGAGAAQGRRIETEATPIRCVAELIGADTDSERALSQKMGKRSHAERQKRYPTANVPGDFAADRGTTAAATTSACVRRRWSCVQQLPTGGVRPNASENGQISPRPMFGLPEVTKPSEPRLCLVGGPEHCEYPSQFGSHPGNPG